MHVHPPFSLIILNCIETKLKELCAVCMHYCSILCIVVLEATRSSLRGPKFLNVPGESIPPDLLVWVYFYAL